MSLIDVVSTKLSDWLWDVEEEEMKVDSPTLKPIIKEFPQEPEAEMKAEEEGDELKPKKYEIDAKIETETITTKSGINLFVRKIAGKPGPQNNGKGKVMLLCSPLGFKDLYVFRPLIAHFGEEFTYLNWNYRGLFDSETPKRKRLVSMRDHAEDALEVLNQMGFENADVVCGHSMGVSVSLEFALLYPEHCERLILINGGHGHLFSTAFQPFVRVPFAGYISETIVSTLLRNNPKRVMEILTKILTMKPIVKTLDFVGKHGGSKMMNEVSGHTFINEWITMYFGGLAGDDKSAEYYCRMFQELHAHSVYHLLDTIEHPTLLISGAFDYLTPSYLMKEMAKRMPNATHYNDWYSTHLTLMEHPDKPILKIDEFLSQTRHVRCSSINFMQLQTKKESSSEK